MSAKYNRENRKARKLGKLNGKTVYRWPVTITNGERAAVLQDADGYVVGKLEVIAHTATDAAYYARNLTNGLPCTQIEVWGVKGGLAKQLYTGFESAIWQQMCADRPQAVQLGLLESFKGDLTAQSQAAVRAHNARLKAQLAAINH